MATIKDVAREANVSVATVSRVMNNSPKVSDVSQKAVTKAMEKLGFRPNANARALVNRKSNIVGVLVADVSDPFFGAMVKAIDTVAKEQGKQTLVGQGYHNAEDEKRALELLINSRCDAMIVHAKGLTDEELTRYIKEFPTIVLINRHIDAIASQCVSLDNFKGAYLATEHLIKKGHKAIAYISSSKDIEDRQSRLEGYFAALQANQLVANQLLISYAEPDSLGGEIAMNNLLASKIPFSAVVAYNDNMAAGALAATTQHNLAVPQQISIVGFDDGIIARLLRPSLTTVHYPISKMAEFATQLALGENEKHFSGVFSPYLVKRNSSTKAP